jgi:hypothetical protein
MIFRFRFFTPLLLFCLAVNYADAQVKLLQGRIYSAKDTTLLAGIHIVNLNTRVATNSFLDGSFLIPYRVGDTLRLTSIGFQDKIIATHFVYIPDAVEVKIFMKEAIYQLPEVDISIYRSKEDFEKAMLQRELSLEEDQRIFYQKAQSIEEVNTDLNAHVSLGSPVGFLYSKFSKEAREKKKVVKALKETKKQETLKRKYNHEVVMRVTGIQDPAEAKMFVKKYPMNEDFLYRATEYDVVKHILESAKKEQQKP